MNVTVIATVLNEEDSIQPFLNALLQQSRMPEEIVIVDAGSQDDTVELINAVRQTYPFVKLFIEEKCNVARGRNVAIRRASYDYIAMTDAGSHVDVDWLQHLIAPFEEDDDVDVVGGWMIMDPQTSFERWAALLHKQFEKIDVERYLPTARSLAVKRKCWEAVGGFPEELTMWSEDTVFLQRLKAQGFKIVLAPRAIVYWRPRRNVKELWTQYYEYGKGDGEASIFPRLYAKRIILVSSIVLFIAGLIVNMFVAVAFLSVIVAAFFKLAVPLKTKSMPVWKLFPVFLLALVTEVAQVAGFMAAKLRRSPR